MNESIAAREPQGGMVKTDFGLATCPGCAGAVFLRATEDGGVEEVCEVCGPLWWQLTAAPRENNPPPVKKGKEGVAPMPLGLEEVFRLRKDIESPPKAPEPCSST